MSEKHISVKHTPTAFTIAYMLNNHCYFLWKDLCEFRKWRWTKNMQEAASMVCWNANSSVGFFELMGHSIIQKFNVYEEALKIKQLMQDLGWKFRYSKAKNINAGVSEC